MCGYNEARRNQTVTRERKKRKEKIHPSFQLRADDGIRRGQDDEKEKSETWKSFEVH